MKYLKLAIFVLSTAVVLSAGSAFSQAPAPSGVRPAPAARQQPAAPTRSAETPARAAEPAPQKKSSSVTATLYRVDEGMFDLRHGQSIDLTDRKIMMTFNLTQHPGAIADRKQVNFMVKGHGYSLEPGQRLDLRTWHITQRDFKDKTECYIDFIDLAAPKGAPMVATLRFECN